MLDIVKAPNDILINPSKPVIKFDKKLHKTIQEMKETLLATVDPIGVGLAAPQVGISIRLFLAKPKEKSKIFVFINPVIENFKDEKVVKKRKTKKTILEGCLSLPTIWGNVARKKELTLTYQDENGEKYTKVFKGFMATIIQHEMDHLEGELFTKKVIEQKQKLYKSYKNDEGQDEFEEIKI